MRARQPLIAFLLVLANCGGRSGLLGGEAGDGSAGAVGVTHAGAMNSGGGGAAGGGAAGGGAAGGGLVRDWMTLSYTAPTPPSNDFTWHGAPARFADVWADAAGSVWVVASTANYKGPSTCDVRRWSQGSWQGKETAFLYAGSLSGLSSSDLWLAAGGVGVEHHDAAGWTPLAEPAASLVWEDSATDVWSCCTGPTEAGGAYRAKHFDGDRWLDLDLPALSDFIPTGLWARSVSDLFIVGSAGFLLHWDGTAWQAQADPGAVHWNAIWGNAQAVWAVGTDAAVARWDAAGWQRIPTSSVLARVVAFNDVWGNESGRVWIVGEQGIVLDWDGSTLQHDDPGTAVSLNAVWGAGGVLWAAGDDETLISRRYE